MSVQPIPAFLTLDFFKLMINSTDTQDDDTYLQFVNNANKKVHTNIFPYIDTPLDEGSIYWDRLHDAALAYARSQHAEDIELLEKSTHYLKKFKVEMFGEDGEHGLVQELKATRTSRTKTVMITVDPRDNKVPLPTQNDIFVFDDFA